MAAALSAASRGTPQAKPGYENPGRKPMVGFNSGTAKEDAVALTSFLCANGFPTFCTGVKYGSGAAAGQNWQIDTNIGANRCNAFIALMTGEGKDGQKGWQKSGETQQEFQIVFKRWTRSQHKDPLIIPVLYESFDDSYDETSGQLWKANLQTCQNVEREASDWMQQVLVALQGNAREAWERVQRPLDELKGDLGKSLDSKSVQARAGYVRQELMSIWLETPEDFRKRSEMLAQLETVVSAHKIMPAGFVPAASVHHWLFLGNPGVGKSTLANAWLFALSGDPIATFQSGMSAGSGLTDTLTWKETDYHKVADLPGLNDPSRRRVAAKAIEVALKEDGNYTICFVCSTKAGRVSPEDMMVISSVLDAAPSIVSYMVLLNKVRQKELDFLKEPENMTKLLGQFHTVSRPPTQLEFMLFDETLDLEKDVVKELPEQVQSALRNVAPMQIRSDSVAPLEVGSWEEREKKLEEAHKVELQKTTEVLKHEYDSRLKALEEELKRQQRKAVDNRKTFLEGELDGARGRGDTQTVQALEGLLKALGHGWLFEVHVNGRNITPDLDLSDLVDVADLTSRIEKTDTYRGEYADAEHDGWIQHNTNQYVYFVRVRTELYFDGKALEQLQEANHLHAVIHMRVVPQVDYWPDGRLFLLDNERVLAPVSWNCRGEGQWPRQSSPGVRGGLGCDLPTWIRRVASQHWLQAGLAEHASLASFSRTSLNLARFAAPPELFAGTHRAALEEIGHADLLFGLAQTFRWPSQERVNVHRLPITSVELCTDLAAFALQVFEEGCVNESMSALLQLYHLPSLEEASPVQPVMERLMWEETAHAALAWRTVMWAAGKGGCPTLEKTSCQCAESEELGIDDLGILDESWRCEPLASWCGIRPPFVNQHVEAVAKRIWLAPWLTALTFGEALPSVEAPPGPVGWAVAEAAARVLQAVEKMADCQHELLQY